MIARDAFPQLEHPVAVPLADTFVAPALLDQEKGREAIGRAVREGILRPFDITRAEIEEPLALWVPFWRTTVSVDGFHITVSKVNVEVGKERRSVPVPSGGARFREAVVMICARTDFPYAPRLPSLFAGIAGISGPAPLEIGIDDMTSPADMAMLEENGARVVDADVDRGRAESKAMGLLLEGVSPTHALYPTYEPRIERASYCLYPVYFASYAYEGEARQRPNEEMFVAVSGRTGQIVAARHPSAVRSVAAKLRRFLSFDQRR